MATRKSTERVAIYPGTFDPPTRGHVDVIERGAKLFDRLVVALLVNSEKQPLLSQEERLALVRGETSRLKNVEVIVFRGLVTHLAQSHRAAWILRGLRSESDLAVELPMAHSNRVCGGAPIETLFLPTRPDLAFVSSRLVREIALGGGDLSPFVSERTAKALRAKLRGR